MKQKTTKGLRLVLGILLSCTVLVACKKEKGLKGDKGATGNANVIGTDMIVVLSADWQAAGNGWTHELSVPEITQEVMDHGLVQVFIRYTTWWPLPYFQGVRQITFGVDVGEVLLYCSNTDNSEAVRPADREFRIVVIAPSQLDANPDVNWNNYTEVQQALGLKN